MGLNALRSTAQTLSFYTRMQALTANNLANSETEAFKADVMSARLIGDATFPVPVTRTDLSQGAMQQTGRPLDLALDGPGFFVVRLEQGGERLTRGGSLALDGANRLSDRHGNLLLGENGPIAIPLRHATLEVQADGDVVVDGVRLDRLRVENVENAASLSKDGAGRYLASQPTVPADTTTTLVRQGEVEESNQDTLRGVVDLVTIQRAYAANVDSLKALDGVLANVVNEVGKVG
ncbi:MAG: flagellar hook basal-body protein [Gemmatimonadetes bacterium]|nr:flagellar hook basal-body protein [Gemmatimonadota bacterium]MBK7349389.1 flagellar hook basal-body protein [Gemmatimonadota bacterium]MBK7784019.1 flagellar hook basal-body protein [Gemmatimonadota bacterium]